MTIKGFITNLRKWNDGELVGKWIEFPIDEDNFQDVLKEIGCNYYDENGEEVATGYEEYFFTDYECDFDHSFGAYESIERLNYVAEQLADWDEDTFNAAVEYDGLNSVIDSDPNDWSLRPDVKDNYDLGRLYAVEYGYVDFGNNDWIERYFDYESYGSDLAYELNGIFTDYGWIERIG